MSTPDKWNLLPEDLKAIFKDHLTQSRRALDELVDELKKLEWKTQPTCESWDSALKCKETFCMVVKEQEENIVDQEKGAAAVEEIVKEAQRVLGPPEESAFAKLFAVDKTPDDPFSKSLLRCKELYEEGAYAAWQVCALLLAENHVRVVIQEDDKASDLNKSAHSEVLTVPVPTTIPVEPANLCGSYGSNAPSFADIATSAESNEADRLRRQHAAKHRLNQRMRDLIHAQISCFETSVRNDTRFVEGIFESGNLLTAWTKESTQGWHAFEKPEGGRTLHRTQSQGSVKSSQSSDEERSTSPV